MHAKTGRLHGKYDKLTNDERFQLIASAVSRHDDEELDVLMSTTPRKTYTMPDASIADRFAAIWRISVIYWLLTEELLREIDTKRHVILHIRSEIELRQLARIDFDKQNSLDIIDKLLLQLTEIECMLWSLSQALHRFAKEVGLEPTELLAYVPQTVKERLSVQLPDCEDQTGGDLLEEMVGSYFQTFATQWPDFPMQAVKQN